MFGLLWINQEPTLIIQFPKDHHKQMQIAAGFQEKSKADFASCAGAIDGMLVWITKPHITDCNEAVIGATKFFCGRKKKFGLAMQAICDSQRRFLDVVVSHPGSASDLLMFNMSQIKKDLDQGLLMKEALYFWR